MSGKCRECENVMCLCDQIKSDKELSEFLTNSEDVNSFMDVILENKRLTKLLERISGMCGHPDAAQACRNIIKVIKENK